MPRPLVLAHRGAARGVPENTPEAFRLALSLGADGVELDVRRDAAGRLVVVHDATLDGVAVRRTAAPPLPALAAALDASAGGIVNVELKTDGDDPRGIAAAACAFLGRRRGRDRALVSSFDAVALRAVRALRPHLPTALVVEDAADVEPALAECALAGHRALHPEAALVDAGLMTRARALGLDVHVWTVDDPAEIARLSALGVDGVITDAVDAALAALAPAVS
jgi:glycerophosphoryl diester phosphodiesterase